MLELFLLGLLFPRRIRDAARQTGARFWPWYGKVVAAWFGVEIPIILTARFLYPALVRSRDIQPSTALILTVLTYMASVLCSFVAADSVIRRMPTASEALRAK